MSVPPLVLASGSASRKAMLAAAAVPFEVQPTDVDEAALRSDLIGVSPCEVATILAEAKAFAGSMGAPGRLVLGSDSLVEVAGRIFCKPASRKDAQEHLRLFSGQDMHLHSAAVLIRDGKVVWRHCDRARLRVRSLSAGFIASYLDAEWPDVAGCAGVFRIEARGVQLFEAIYGDHFTVLGMPLLAVLGALRELGELAS